MTNVTTIQNSQHDGRRAERGNVLFLILIAVALFAALSYAVTQSTRSGSGDATGETNLINSAQLAQYPAGVRTAIVRMIISGTQVDQLVFNPPSDFAAISTPNPDLTEVAVFHPNGGGAVFSNAPSEMMVATGPNPSGRWAFNMQAQIQDVGITDAANNVGNDLIAFLPGVAENVCRRLDIEAGIITGNAAIPTGPAYTPDPATQADYMDDGYLGAPATPVVIIGSAGSIEFQGQPFGCYLNGANHVYYHVLVEQ